MRLHRFYVPQQIGNESEITIRSAEFVNQVRRVFRLKGGDSLIIFNGTGFDYECKIDDTYSRRILTGNDNSLRLYVTTTERSAFSPARKIYLFASLVKKNTFEWIVQKATELGVTHIIPVISERSEKKSLNESRLKKIAIEASEQSGRGDVPEILPIMNLEEAITTESVTAVAFHTEGEHFSKEKISKDGPAAVFIGPEGGWSQSEIDMFHKQNIPVLCLGKQVLRSETAVIAALSQVVFH
jgi:16S rRNA (uracil1498-N3)-methyltransferase